MFKVKVEGHFVDLFADVPTPPTLAEAFAVRVRRSTDGCHAVLDVLPVVDGEVQECLGNSVVLASARGTVLVPRAEADEPAMPGEQDVWLARFIIDAGFSADSVADAVARVVARAARAVQEYRAALAAAARVAEELAGEGGE